MSADDAKVIINLASRPDRRREMEFQLRSTCWGDATFFTAFRPQDAGQFPSVGARGCFESHLAILKMPRYTPSNLIIMEDDLNFVRNFQEDWRSVEQHLKRVKWDIVYLGHYLESGGGNR